MDDSEVRLTISGRFALGQVGAAQTQLDEGGSPGKMLVTVSQLIRCAGAKACGGVVHLSSSTISAIKLNFGLRTGYKSVQAHSCAHRATADP